MDFGTIQPEITSTLIYSGPGSGPMAAAAAAWNQLAAGLHSAALSYGSVISGLAGGSWSGAAAATMAAAVAPYVSWMHTTAAQADQAAAGAAAAAGAYETARSATVPPPLIAANRSLLMELVSTNVLGQNAPAIASTEAEYDEMWAQDAAAMFGYAGSAGHAASVQQFSQPPVATNQAAMPSAAAAVGTASTATVGAGAQNVMSTGSALMSQTATTLQGLSSPAVSSTASSGTSTLTTLELLQEVPSLMYPATMGIMPLSMILSPLINRGLMGLGAVGAATGLASRAGGVIPVMGSAFGHGLGAGVGALGAAGSAGPPVVLAGMGQAGSMGAMSVPPVWPGAAGGHAATLAGNTVSMNPVHSGAGAIPYGMMPAGGAATGREAGPSRWELGRLLVVPRSPVLG